MSAQRERPAAEANHRSVVPNIPGVPWWAAVLIAVGMTAVGYAFDAGHKDLTHTFAGFYIFGCVAAVLAVRQAAVFTAVIQPPLILFCTVPGAYWLFHGGKVDKFKDLLINCGYPLIERFPLMLGTAGFVLLIGLLRWFFGKNAGTVVAGKDADGAPADRPPLLSTIVAKLSTLFSADEDLDAAEAPPAHSRTRSARNSRTSRSTARSGQRSARTRSRPVRPEEAYEPGAERTREPGGERTRDPNGERPRRSTARRSSVPPPEGTDYDPSAPPRTRRRRPPGDSDLGAPPPREMRREPHARRNPYERSYERPEPRGNRVNPYATYDRPKPSEPGERRNRHERRGSGYEPYQPYEPSYDPPREPRARRAAPTGSNNINPNHQSVSQVRYRGQPPRTEPRDERRAEAHEEPGSERRSRPRPQRRPQEYDA